MSKSKINGTVSAETVIGADRGKDGTKKENTNKTGLQRQRQRQQLHKRFH